MKKLLILSVLIVTLLLIADPPTGGGRTLIFSTFSNGGTELPAQRHSTRFLLSDVLGRGTSASTDRLEGSTYHLYGGFRNVDLDLREPFSSAETPEFISSSAMFYVSWAGIDTTIEDGEGWGIWKYDIQWSKSSDPGTWHDWHTETELSNDWFGPSDPTVVKPDTVYYFRVRAYDLVGNVFDWTEGAVADASDSVRYNPPMLGFSIRKTDGDSVWVTETLDEDGIALNRASDVFVVKNNSVDAIDVGLYSFNTTHWELQDEPAMDAFSVRAIMNDEANRPDTTDFDLTTALQPNPDGITWGSPTELGGGGYNIAPAGSDSTLRTENLWLQVHAPTWVTRYGGYDEEIILIKAEARNTIY